MQPWVGEDPEEAHGQSTTTETPDRWLGFRANQWLSIAAKQRGGQHRAVGVLPPFSLLATQPLGHFFGEPVRKPPARNHWLRIAVHTTNVWALKAFPTNPADAPLSRCYVSKNIEPVKLRASLGSMKS